jgi:tetratricopeptide (TPR) repeat protein
MTNVHEILAKVRSARQKLPFNEAAVLYAAVVRLAAAQGATLRARLVEIDDSGGLHLLAFDDQAPEIEPGYLAPELHGADAPRKSEPRVQVYAAGALGFELLTGHMPPGNLAELTGPLGDIVKMALAPDRRERFGDLTQLQDALEGVQPRPPAEGERNIFNSLRTRWMRAPMEKEAVARLIEKLGQLEIQVTQLAKAQTRIDAAHRQTQEHLDRFEEGQQRLQRAPPSAIGPALLAGLLSAAAVVAAAWALGLFTFQRGHEEARAPLVSELPDASFAEEKSPFAAAAPEKRMPAATAAPEKKPPAAEVAEKPLPADAAVEAYAPIDAGAALAQTPDAGEPAAAIAPSRDVGSVVAAAPAATAAPAEPAPKRRRQPEVTQRQLMHAVAISQVRRGESALEKSDAAEALASFRAALDNEPALPVAYRGIGMAYAMQGNDAQALQAYQRYLQLAPSAPDKGDIRRSIAELKARAKIGTGEK